MRRRSKVPLLGHTLSQIITHVQQGHPKQGGPGDNGIGDMKGTHAYNNNDDNNNPPGGGRRGTGGYIYTSRLCLIPFGGALSAYAHVRNLQWKMTDRLQQAVAWCIHAYRL